MGGKYILVGDGTGPMSVLSLLQDNITRLKNAAKNNFIEKIEIV
jgi:hypothetical protein